MCYVERTNIAKTRKVFRCEYCWQIIEQGSPCARDRGIVDGQWFVARLHPECADHIARTFEFCETYTPGEGDRPTVEAGH
jgi:hypothetical protein